MSAAGSSTRSQAAPACLSMTGYAQARAEYDGWMLRVSVRSVNHRYLDVRLRLPEGLEVFEPRIRRTLRDRIRRGHVDVNVYVEPTSAAAVQVNRALAQAYLQAAEELRRQIGTRSELDVLSVLRLPGVIANSVPNGSLSEEEQEKLGARMTGCLEEALEKLDEMRRSEGRHLAEEMRARLAEINGRTEKIERFAEEIRPAHTRRLEARLKELLGGAGLDPARLAQEAAILAERGDITEELTRLRSHVAQFGRLLDGAGELGKKLDFLLQEMQREANTMLSKTPGVETEGLRITDLALEIKGEIEKLREQVQNVE